MNENKDKINATKEEMEDVAMRIEAVGNALKNNLIKLIKQLEEKEEN